MKSVVAQNSRKKTCMPPESSSKLRMQYLDEDCFFPSILGLVTFSCFAFRIWMICNFGLQVTYGDEWTQNDNLKLFPPTYDAQKNMYTWTLELRRGGGVRGDNEQIGGKAQSRWLLGCSEGGGWRCNVVFLVLMWEWDV